MQIVMGFYLLDFFYSRAELFSATDWYYGAAVSQLSRFGSFIFYFIGSVCKLRLTNR